MQTADQINDEMNRQVVATVMGRAVTRGELSAAFDCVRPAKNWKLPIDAQIELDEFGVNLTQEAIIYFTGGPAHFDQVRPVVNGKARYQVSAPGYYAVCGA